MYCTSCGQQGGYWSLNVAAFLWQWKGLMGTVDNGPDSNWLITPSKVIRKAVAVAGCLYLAWVKCCKLTGENRIRSNEWKCVSFYRNWPCQIKKLLRSIYYSRLDRHSLSLATKNMTMGSCCCCILIHLYCPLVRISAYCVTGQIGNAWRPQLEWQEKGWTD